MPKLKSYRELEVWKRAMDLVESIYKLTEKLPSQEKFGLSSQIQRAAVSIPANIAEGYGQSYLKGYIHHLHIASGSLAELETYLFILQRLSYADEETIEINWAICQEIGKMLRALISALEKKLK